jgi:hypothetical protein
MLALDPADRPDAAEVERLLGLRAVPAPTAPRRLGLVGIAAGAAMVLAGASLVSRSAGSAPEGRPSTPAATPVSAIGDPRTADPCALMDPAGFQRFGRAELSTDYGNFNRCDVLIRRGDDDLADVKVELANGPAPEPGTRDRVERRGSVEIVAEPAGGGECDRTLVLADGNLVEVTAQRTGRGTMDFCAAATLATDRAATVLGRGRVPRRSRALPARSLGNLDACALLDPAALARVRGVDGVRPEAGFGRWDCHWHSRTGDTAIQLRFDRNGPLTAADGHPKRLGGHQAYITPRGDGSGTCLAQVVHRTYADTGGTTTAELLFLVVSGSGSGERLCDSAETLASAAAARLPAG